ncbi:calcium/calmodulin-dependent/calcium-dependent protein kinase, partial [Kipferlia bialata]
VGSIQVRDRIFINYTTKGELAIDRYLLKKTLGRGAFAIVKEGVDVFTGAHRAMRIINRFQVQRKSGRPQEEVDGDIWREVRILDAVAKHPYILSLDEVLYDSRDRLTADKQVGQGRSMKKGLMTPRPGMDSAKKSHDKYRDCVVMV